MDITCDHTLNKYHCKICNPKIVCEHKIIKKGCKICNPKIICEHNINKNSCKLCKPELVCEHNINKKSCKICNPDLICEHNIKKTGCKLCYPKLRCEHNIIKYYCKICNPKITCEHNIFIANCKICNPKRVCEHNINKNNCKLCNPKIRCLSLNCETTANRKYNNYCAFCFINTFPEDARSIKAINKSKELKVVIYILNKYEDFIYNKPFYVDLQGGCCATKRRIDLRRLINNTMLCIEIDEDQHKQYIKKDENIRYDDLFMDFTGKYIFIRYNPDKYKDKYNKSKNPYFYNRMEALENIINKQIARIENNDNIELLEIYHLFYDEI